MRVPDKAGQFGPATPVPSGSRDSPHSAVLHRRDHAATAAAIMRRVVREETAGYVRRRSEREIDQASSPLQGLRPVVIAGTEFQHPALGGRSVGSLSLRYLWSAKAVAA